MDPRRSHRIALVALAPVLVVGLCLLSSTGWAQAPIGPGASSAHDAPADGPVDAAVERGNSLLESYGCRGCHSSDGSAGVGPTFADRFGGVAAVVVDGQPRAVAYDRAYLIRAMTAPDAELAAGYPAGVMPAYTAPPDDVVAIEAALVALAQASPEPAPAGWGPLVAGVLLFVLGHLLLSSGPVRGALARLMGEVPFQIAYSVVALGGMILMVEGYDYAPYVELWPAFRWTRHITLTAMPLAMILVVMGYTTPSPTAAGQAQRAEDRDAVTGILTVTRHPALWGFTVWALAHIPPNGDLASALFFGAFAALSVLGMAHIDRRRARAGGEAWAAFARRTSLVPFAAALTGRTRLRFGARDGLRLLIALAVFGGALLIHQWLFGVSPLG